MNWDLSLNRFPILPLIYPEIVGGQNSFTNILLIDNSIPSYQTFVDSANSATFPIVYSVASSKESLLTLLQTNFTNIQRIGMVFTSGSKFAKPFLDIKPLFLETESEPYSENLQFIIDVIHQFSVKNIDFLACDTLSYSTWTNYYAILTEKTGVVVGASNDKTGNIKYGGDWVLESTSEDIETIYFTQNIEYYTYLLDNLNWATGIYSSQMVIDSTSTYMYVWFDNSIIRITMSNPSITTTIVTGVYYLGGGNSLAIDNTDTYLYVSINEYGYGKIYRIQLSNPSYTLWFPNINGFRNPSGISIDNTNTYLYVGINDNGGAGYFITQILISNPATYNLQWVTVSTTLNLSFNVMSNALDNTNTYMYIVILNTSGTTGTNVMQVDRVQMSNKTYTTSWVTGTITTYCNSIHIDKKGKYMYVSSMYNPYNNYQIAQIQISNKQINYNFGNGTGAVTDSGASYLYVSTSSGISQFSLVPPYPCFKEGSRILTDKGYFPIESLKKGDLIKTVLHGYVPICMIGKRDIEHTVSEERIKEQLYKCTQPQYPEVFEDLVLTGCHSILVSNFKDEQEKEATMKVLKITDGNMFITDNKYRLPACVDDRASVYEIPGTYTIYHLALEHESYYMNYGIYANGLLVESCSQRYLKELSQMELF